MAELTTIARPYAQAVFKLAKEQGTLDAWSDKLALMALIASDADMAALLGSPRVTEDQLADLFIDLCGEQAGEDGKNLIRVLAENRRLPAMAEIYRLFEQAKNAEQGSIKAQLITAFPATDEQKATIIAALKKRLGRDIELECETDESLVGGAIIRAGDLVIDGSVRGKLARLGTALSH